MVNISVGLKKGRLERILRNREETIEENSLVCRKRSIYSTCFIFVLFLFFVFVSSLFLMILVFLSFTRDYRNSKVNHHGINVVNLSGMNFVFELQLTDLHGYAH